MENVSKYENEFKELGEWELREKATGLWHGIRFDGRRLAKPEKSEEQKKPIYKLRLKRLAQFVAVLNLLDASGLNYFGNYPEKKQLFLDYPECKEYIETYSSYRF